NAQGTATQSAAQASISTAQDTAGTQGTAGAQDTDPAQGTAATPKSPNDYTPTDASQTSGGDEGLLRYICFEQGKNQNLKKQKRRRKKHKKKVSSVKLGRNKDEGTLSEEHNVQEEDSAHPFFDDTADQDAAVTPDLERKSD
ncbi:hypothetical protein Tco_0292408, partial [Tanacetum coccineum]